MKHVLLTTALVVLIPAGLVLAQSPAPRAAMADWQPFEAVVALAGQNGWTLREVEIDDGHYEVKALTADGQLIEAYLDPVSLAVLKTEVERPGDDDDDDDHGRSDDDDEDDDDDDYGARSDAGRLSPQDDRDSTGETRDN